MRVSGDTVYYEVELYGVSEAKYPKYNFTVYGTQEGRCVHTFLFYSSILCVHMCVHMCVYICVCTCIHAYMHSLICSIVH